MASTLPIDRTAAASRTLYVAVALALLFAAVPDSAGLPLPTAQADVAVSGHPSPNDSAPIIDPIAQTLSSVRCCQEDDYSIIVGYKCRYNLATGPKTWTVQGLSDNGKAVRHQTCCRSGYGTPTSSDATFPFVCADAPANVSIPLGSFGCSSNHTCAGNAICVRRSMEQKVNTYGGRCECASLGDASYGNGTCVWDYGSVPAGKVVSSAKGCRSQRSTPFSATDSVCMPNTCNCVSPDDENYTPTSYVVDDRCKCWTSNVPFGKRVLLSSSCSTGYSVPTGSDKWETCVCPSPDDVPDSADGKCKWAAGSIPHGKRVYAKWGASGCASRWADATRNDTSNKTSTVTCGCVSIDDPLTAATDARCGWSSAASVPNHARVPSGLAKYCKSGFSFAENDSGARDVCACASAEDEAFLSGLTDVCTWAAGMVPPRYHVKDITRCFFQPGNATLSAAILNKNGTVACPDPTYTSPEDLMAKINTITSSYDKGYWAFAEGTAHLQCYKTVSLKLTSNQHDSIRDRYASDGISSQYAASWKASLSNEFFVNLVKAELHTSCDENCRKYVFGVLFEEFTALTAMAGLFSMTKVALDSQDRTYQANVDLAKQTVQAEDTSEVKPAQGFGNFVLGVFSTICSAAAKTFFKTNLIAKFSLYVASGVLTELKTTTTPEEYDTNASSEVAAAQLKSELNERYLKLLAAYTRSFGTLTSSPLKMRMLSVIHNTYDATTESDIAEQIVAQQPAVLASLVRILFPAKWHLCQTQTQYIEYRDVEYGGGGTTVEVVWDQCSRSASQAYEKLIPADKKVDVTDLVDLAEQYGDIAIAWFCPDGRFADGKTVSMSTFESAGVDKDSVAAFHKELVRAVLTHDASVELSGWGGFNVQSPCPADK